MEFKKTEVMLNMVEIEILRSTLRRICEKAETGEEVVVLKEHLKFDLPYLKNIIRELNKAGDELGMPRDNFV